MEDKRNVLREEVYDIQTPVSLVIGDPLYLEAIKTQPKRQTKDLRKMVFIQDKIPAVRKAKLVFREVEIYPERPVPYLPGCFKEYEAEIIVSNKEYIGTFLNGMYYPDAVKARYRLGCDTAGFTIAAGYKDGIRETNICTGADGQYGYAAENVAPFGFTVSLWLDADFCGESQLRENFAYLFGRDEIGRNRF